MGHGAVVQERREHAADDRTEYVEPDAREVYSYQHRPEGACRVDRTAGDRARYKDPDSQGETNRYRGYACRRPVVGRDRHYHEDEDESDQYFQTERVQVTDALCRVRGRQVCLARARSAEREPGAQGTEHGPN